MTIFNEPMLYSDEDRDPIVRITSRGHVNEVVSTAATYIKINGTNYYEVGNISVSKGDIVEVWGKSGSKSQSGYSFWTDVGVKLNDVVVGYNYQTYNKLIYSHTVTKDCSIALFIVGAAQGGEVRYATITE